MRHAVLALALAAISSTAQTKITELQCAATNGHQWAVSTDDQRGRATLTYYGDGTVIGDIPTAFTPDEVRMEWGDNYFFRIDRTTLQFKAGSHSDSDPMHGACRISQRANRKFSEALWSTNMPLRAATHLCGGRGEQRICDHKRRKPFFSE